MGSRHLCLPVEHALDTLNPQEGWIVVVRGVYNENPESELDFNKLFYLLSPLVGGGGVVGKCVTDENPKSNLELNLGFVKIND